MKRWLPASIALLGAVILLVWWKAPARVVERRTRALLEVITVPASSGKPARLMRPNSLAPFLAPSISFLTPANEVNGDLENHDVLAGFGHVASAATETRFTMLDVRSVEVAGDAATIRFELEVYTDLHGHDSANGRHEARIDWRKADGDWRVVAVDVRPNLP